MLSNLFDHSNVCRLIFGSLMLCVISDADAQTAAYPFYSYPENQITRSITAQGDIIRANGEAYRNYQAGNLYYARARQELAVAVDKELDNWGKQVRVYWDRRLEREKRRMELLEAYETRKDGYGERREAARERLLKSILTDTERTRLAVESGTALNKLLDAFSNTSSRYGLELGPSLRQSLGDINLTTETLYGLQVKSTGAGNKQTFRLTESTGMDLSWWPDLLRRPSYEVNRESIVIALDQVAKQSTNQRQVDVSLLDELDDQLGKLSKAFYGTYPQEVKRKMPTHEMRQYCRAEDFLMQVNQDLQRMRDTGNGLAMGNAKVFKPEVDGKDVPSLIYWMLQNGVTFAKSTAGNEAYYHQLFGKMSNLYAVVAE